MKPNSILHSKTKIVCTIGPACDSPDMIRSLIEKGMNVARLNFSHGTHDEHLDKIKTIRDISEKMERSVPGFTAKQISRFRPISRLVALSPDKKALRKLALYWGCEPGWVAVPKSTDEMIEAVAVSALETGAVQKGDLIVITAGHPVWVEGTTNMMKVKRLT